MQIHNQSALNLWQTQPVVADCQQQTVTENQLLLESRQLSILWLSAIQRRVNQWFDITVK